MIQKPRLKTFLTLFPLSETTWGVRGGSDELWRLKLRDERAIRTLTGLIPWLNGAYGTPEVLERAQAQGIDREAAEELLQCLQDSALLEDADPHGLTPEDQERFRHQINYFSRFTTEGGARYQATLGATHLGVVGDGVLADAVRRQAEATGFGRITVRSRNAFLEMNGEAFGGEGERTGVVMVPQESHDPRLMEGMDAFSKRHDTPWMLLRAVDTREGWVGPLFVPGDTADYLSLEARLSGNVSRFPEYTALNDHLRARDAAGAPVGGLQACYEVLAGIALAEVVKLVTGVAVPHLAGRFLTVNLSTWDTEAHDVLRVPRIDFEAAQRPNPSPWKEIQYGGDKDSSDRILTRRA